MLNDADMIVMIDRHYEGFLQNTLQALPQRPTIIEVVETPNIALYEARKLERYSKRHDHHGHDHHGHHHHDEESHYHAGGIDPHIWLDPDNAVIITLHLARRLADRDPKNGAKYLQNANRFLLTINSLQSNIRQLLKIPPLDKDTIAYLTFHDAYQYYENHFNLALSPYITPSPEIALGAKSVQQLHAMARRKEINCIFKEPQFSSKLVDQLAQKTGAKVMEIDPLGSDFPKGKDAYFRLMHKLTEAVQHCMKPKLKQ
jgi:zinc transport system substrate-binding protein